MSTNLEDRLTAALAARADLVQPEDLQPPAPFAAYHPLRRSTALLAAASVVIAGAIAAVLLTGNDDRPEPADQPMPNGYVEIDRATGDVDGDGRADLVRVGLSEPDLVRLEQAEREEVLPTASILVVDAAAGDQVTVTYPAGPAPRLEGLTKVGLRGRAIVTRQSRPNDAFTLVVYGYESGILKQLRPTAPGLTSDMRTDYEFAYDVGSRLTTWQLGSDLEALQRVTVSRWAADKGRLVARNGGIQCWRVPDPKPSECPEITEIPSGYVTGIWDAVDLDRDGALDQIRVASRPGDPDKGNPVVIVRLDSGKTTGLHLPAGGPPPAEVHSLRLPEEEAEVPVLAVEGDFPDGGPLSLYRMLDGRLTEVRVDRGAPVDPMGPGKQISWTRVRDGVLVGWTSNTVRTPSGEVRVDIYSFEVDGTQLIPVREGEQCFDPNIDELPRPC